MTSNENDIRLLTEYLSLLGVPAREPSLKALKELVRAQMMRVPFENISKLRWKHEIGGVGLPDLKRFLHGIRDYNFGGTCYTNASHFHSLLAYLGYDVKLCGADMSQPDVHLVNIVTVEGGEYLIDVGYAAPFLEPLPRDLDSDYVIKHGDGRYVLRPRDDRGWSRMDYYEDGQLTHGYRVNPRARRIEEFSDVVEDSFRDSSTFMQSVMLVRFAPERAIRLKNLSLTITTSSETSKSQIESRDRLPEVVEHYFGIPAEISRETLRRLGPFATE